MSVLKNKQSGSTTLINLSQAVTVSSYTLSKSILYFTFNGGDAQVDRSLVRAVKTNSTTITFYRANSTGTSPVINWDLLEFDGDTDVQDIDESGTGTRNTTLTSIDTTKSFVVSSGVTNPDDTFTDTTSARLEITSATNVRRVTGSSGSSANFSYQVVEQAGSHGVSGVQYYTLASQAGTTLSQTITSVTPGRTVIYGSAKPNEAYDYSDVFSLSLASSTSVTGARTGTASMDVGIYVVQYDTNVIVQRGSTTVGTDTDVTISAVQVENAFSRLCGAHSCGFALGYQSVETSNGDFASVKALIELTTNLNLSRMLSTTGTVTANWQVIEADPSATSNILINDTPSYDGSWGTPLTFNHTLGGNDNRILVVCASSRGNSPADTALSCSFNGVSMPSAVTKTTSPSGFNVRSTIFYMLHSNLPAAGTYSVVVSCSTGSPQSIEAVAYSVRGAKQQAPEATTSAGADASAGYISTGITTVTANGLSVDCLVGDNTPTGVCGTGQTLVVDYIHGGTCLMASYRETGLAEEWKFAWTLQYTVNRWAHTIASFEQAPTGVVENLTGSSAGSSAVSGAVKVHTQLIGASAGDANVGATLKLKRGLSTAVAGDTNVAGGLTTPVRFVATSHGLSAVEGSLEVLKRLSGQSDGTSTFSADLTLPVYLEGTSAGVASVAGTLASVKFFQAVSNGVATVSAELLTHMGGQSHGSSNVEGTLNLIRRLVATIEGSSDVSAWLNGESFFHGESFGEASVEGTLTTTHANTFLTGHSAGSSTVSGSMRILKRMFVGVPGVAHVSGTLIPYRVLEGASNGDAIVSGSLEVLKELTAQAHGAASVAGSLSILVALAGGSAGASDVDGSLYGQIELLNGESVGQATVEGTLTILTRRLAGVIAGMATASASLQVHVALAGLVEALADVEADLHMIRGITGRSDGIAGVAGTVVVTRTVVAAIAAGATVAGSLDIQKALQAAIHGVATVSASLLSDVPVAGLSQGESIVDAALSVLKALEATASGESTVEGALGRIRPLATQSDGESVVAADIMNFVNPSGTSNGMATVTVALKVRKALEAVIAGESVPAAALNVALALIGESLGLSYPYGTLNIEGLGLGPASSRGRARVRGDLTVIHFTSSHSLKDDPRIIVRTIP